MDRTQEFLQIARMSSQCTHVSAPASKQMQGPHKIVSPFSAGVKVIDRGLDVVAHRLAALRTLSTECASPFRTLSDTQAVHVMTYAIRTDLRHVGSLVAELLTQNPDIVNNGTLAMHSHRVVDILRSRVLAMNRELESVLSTHSERMQIKLKHETIFSLPSAMSHESKPEQQQQSTQQQQQHESPQSHGEVALQQVQRTLLQTGALVQHLALLVAEQGELAVRIDDNMEAAAIDVERATQHVTSYFHREVTSSTGGWLLMRALGVVGITLLVVIMLV